MKTTIHFLLINRVNPWYAFRVMAQFAAICTDSHTHTQLLIVRCSLGRRSSFLCFIAYRSREIISQSDVIQKFTTQLTARRAANNTKSDFLVFGYSLSFSLPSFSCWLMGTGAFLHFYRLSFNIFLFRHGIIAGRCCCCYAISI